jgi:fermentation-respiration switch protein FrsA (DUF1100 family)
MRMLTRSSTSRSILRGALEAGSGRAGAPSRIVPVRAFLQSADVFGARRKRRAAEGPTAPDVDRFREVAALVDAAKDALLAAVPGRRGPGVPVAEALAAFEEQLGAARAALDDWPASHGGDRLVLEKAIDASLRRAETLRMEASPEGYEELYALLGDVLDPLDAVAEVAERLRRASS